MKPALLKLIALPHESLRSGPQVHANTVPMKTDLLRSHLDFVEPAAPAAFDSQAPGRDCDAEHLPGREAVPRRRISKIGERSAITARAPEEASPRREASDRTCLVDAAHAARLSAVGRMFSELVHELNQPLAAAANYARACVAFAHSTGSQAEPMVEWMQKAVDQTSRAIELVKRLSSFVRKDGGLRGQVDINRRIEQTVSWLVPAIHTPTAEGAALQLELNLDQNIPEIEADGVQLEQVLVNLIRNAIEAMHDAAIRAPRLCIETSQDADSVAIAIRDNGPGISPHNLQKLFEPYFTTKAAGMGLGLSLSRSIVEDHDGSFHVDSSSNGTTFQFTFPKASQDAMP